jgi:hypothetical protein
MAGGEPTLDWRVRTPEHVVYRDFPGETVILNLHSGEYHGLNRTAAQMLEQLTRSDAARDAVTILVEQLGQPPDVIERDVLALCARLSDRGLILDARDA